jgi:hypothetical protein
MSSVIKKFIQTQRKSFESVTIKCFPFVKNKILHKNLFQGKTSACNFFISFYLIQEILLLFNQQVFY